MANRRMYALTVVDSDKFLDLPIAAQLLYFHLGMRADDDGIIGSAKRIMRLCDEFDSAALDALIQAGYIIRFPSGHLAIVDWHICNEIRTDRYHPTIYQDEFEALTLDNSKRYILKTNLEPDWRQNVSSVGDILDTELDKASLGQLGQDSRGEFREGEVQEGEPNFTQFEAPSLEAVTQYAEEQQFHLSPLAFFTHYQSNGWKNGREGIKNWRAVYKSNDRLFAMNALPWAHNPAPGGENVKQG